MRPIDLQVTIPKMTEIASLQGSESTKRLLSLQQSAQSTKAMVDADTREVHAKKNVQSVNLRVNRDKEQAGRDGRGGRGGRKGQRGAGAGAGAGVGKESKGDKLAGPASNGGLSQFDIKL